MKLNVKQWRKSLQSSKWGMDNEPNTISLNTSEMFVSVPVSRWERGNINISIASFLSDQMLRKSEEIYSSLQEGGSVVKMDDSFEVGCIWDQLSPHDKR